MHALQFDRLSVSERDHRIAVGVVCQMRLDISEARETGVADQVKLIVSSIEAVDRVMSDRLRENKEVLTTRAGQVILARPGKDRRALREDLHVVGGPGESAAAVGVGPAHRDLERHRARIIGGRGDGEHRDRAGLDRPAAIAVVGALAQGPAGRNAGDCHRYGTHVVGRIGEAQVHGAAGNARWKDMAPSRGGEINRAACRIPVAVDQNKAHGLAAEACRRLEGKSAGRHHHGQLATDDIGVGVYG